MRICTKVDETVPPGLQRCEDEMNSCLAGYRDGHDPALLGLADWYVEAFLRGAEDLEQ